MVSLFHGRVFHIVGVWLVVGSWMRLRIFPDYQQSVANSPTVLYMDLLPGNRTRDHCASEKPICYTCLLKE